MSQAWTLEDLLIWVWRRFFRRYITLHIICDGAVAPIEIRRAHITACARYFGPGEALRAAVSTKAGGWNVTESPEEIRSMVEWFPVRRTQ